MKLIAALLPLTAHLHLSRTCQQSFRQNSRCQVLSFSSTSVVLSARRKRSPRSATHTQTPPPILLEDGEDDFTPTNGRQPNRRQRMELILERDGAECVWCRVPLDLSTATTDHVIPKLKGGPSWVENEVASCRRCNKQRGHTKPIEWAQQCPESNSQVIVRQLHALEEAIQRRGGQRKARKLLLTQMKRIQSNKEWRLPE